MDKYSRILVTGAHGFVGRSLVSYLQGKGYANIVSPSRFGLDLTERLELHTWFDEAQPDYVFHLAAMVFGIMGNIKNQSVSYLNNTLINTHVVEAAVNAGVKKIVAMGTVAMYPDKPASAYTGFKEEDIWSGPPHHSEFGYGCAKRNMMAHLALSGVPWACAISTNLYGPEDRFNIETGHVLPSLVRKFYEAKRDGTPATVWGNAATYRDFLHVSDVCRALVLIMEKGSGAINMASGQLSHIGDAVNILSRHTGVEAQFDISKPTGQEYRKYDLTKLHDLGFIPRMSLKQGLTETYDWYAKNESTARKQ